MDQKTGFSEDVKIVVAWRFYSESLARLYQSKLSFAGIESFLSNQLTSNLIPFGDGGILLHVKKSDLSKSVEIIEQTYADFQYRKEDDFFDADIGDIEYEKQVSTLEKRISNTNQLSFESKIVFILIGLALAIFLSYLSSF